MVFTVGATSLPVQKNVLESLSKMCSYKSPDGELVAHIEFAHPGDTTEEVKDWMLELVRDNMKEMYIDAGWGWDDGQKRRELVDEAARYLIAFNAEGERIGFTHFRLMMEGLHEVLYVYELHLVESARRKGLGKRLMQLMELIAIKESMRWVMLTVFKENESAQAFYTDKLKYAVDEISPGRTSVAREFTYDILSKCVDPELRKVYKQMKGDLAVPCAGPTRRVLPEQLIADAAVAALAKERDEAAEATPAAAAAGGEA